MVINILKAGGAHEGNVSGPKPKPPGSGGSGGKLLFSGDKPGGVQSGTSPEPQRPEPKPKLMFAGSLPADAGRRLSVLG